MRERMECAANESLQIDCGGRFDFLGHYKAPFNILSDLCSFAVTYI